VGRARHDPLSSASHPAWLLASGVTSSDVGVVRDGKPVTRGGGYLTVWQLQTDGAWKILRNIVLP